MTGKEFDFQGGRQKALRPIDVTKVLRHIKLQMRKPPWKPFYRHRREQGTNPAHSHISRSSCLNLANMAKSLTPACSCV